MTGWLLDTANNWALTTSGLAIAVLFIIVFYLIAKVRKTVTAHGERIATLEGRTGVQPPNDEGES